MGTGIPAVHEYHDIAGIFHHPEKFLVNGIAGQGGNGAYDHLQSGVLLLYDD